MTAPADDDAAVCGALVLARNVLEQERRAAVAAAQGVEVPAHVARDLGAQRARLAAVLAGLPGAARTQFEARWPRARAAAAQAWAPTRPDAPG